MAPLPFAKRLPGNAEVAAGSRHVAGGLARPLQHLDPPAPQPRLLHLRHSVSASQISTNEDAVDAAVPVDAQNAPQKGLGNYNAVSTAPTALILCSKKPNRREPEVSTLCWDFTQGPFRRRMDSPL